MPKRSAPASVRAALSSAISHRGPDSSGYFGAGDPVLLVHQRLSILDLSPSGQQPMTDHGNRYVIAFNGEIYNHLELREKHCKNQSFRSNSDTETLLELFAKLGTDCFALLNGIFAAAIWDKYEKTLTLVRDGVGVKPLYVWQPASGGLAFGSELKAIAALPGFTSTLDPVAAGGYVTHLWSAGDRTMFADVSKFSAGTWMCFDETGRLKKSQRFYTLPEYRPSDITSDDAILQTEKHLKIAVERQLLSDVEVGAFLSGGLDSTAIVSLAKAHHQTLRPDNPMQCFTLAYDGGESSEKEIIADLPYAKLAAEHLGVSLHEVKIDPSVERDLPFLVDMLDEPQADLAAMGNYLISSAARERGIKVLLSGAGGDDIFTGYRRHRQFASDRLLGLLPSSIRAAMLAGVSTIKFGGEKRRVLRKLLSGLQGDESDRLCAAFAWLPAKDAASLLDSAVNAEDIESPLREALGKSVGSPPIERLLRLEQEFFLRDHNLNYVDKTGMRAGVEIRVPFLDPDLMAFAATIPSNMKIRDRKTKWVLRKAMEKRLPHSIIYRPKTGFGVPLRTWMKGSMKDTVYDLTDSSVVARRGLFEPKEVLALREAHYSGSIDAAYPLLAIMMVEIWCRRFSDQNGLRASA